MPVIPINLGSVEAWTDLPLGSYLGDIDRIKWQAPSQPGKFAQLMVTYVCVDEQALGKKQSQWLSLSPKALGITKRWFQKFGLGELPELVTDEGTDELIEPDLIGTRVIFQVAQDKRDATRVRTELVSVEDDVAPPAAKVAAKPTTITRPAARAATPVARPASPAAPVLVQDATQTLPAVVPAVDAKAKAREALKAQLAALEADDDLETIEEPAAAEAEEAPVAAVTPRRRAAAPAAEADPQPQRRTLR